LGISETVLSTAGEGHGEGAAELIGQIFVASRMFPNLAFES